MIVDRQLTSIQILRAVAALGVLALHVGNEAATRLGAQNPLPNLNGAPSGPPDGGGAAERSTQPSAIARQAVREATQPRGAAAKPNPLAQVVSKLSPFGVERGR